MLYVDSEISTLFFLYTWMHKITTHSSMNICDLLMVLSNGPSSLYIQMISRF